VASPNHKQKKVQKGETLWATSELAKEYQYTGHKQEDSKSQTEAKMAEEHHKVSQESKENKEHDSDKQDEANEKGETEGSKNQEGVQDKAKPKEEVSLSEKNKQQQEQEQKQDKQNQGKVKSMEQVAEEVEGHKSNEKPMVKPFMNSVEVMHMTRNILQDYGNEMSGNQSEKYKEEKKESRKEERGEAESKTTVKGSSKGGERKICISDVHGTERKTCTTCRISGNSLHGRSLFEMLEMDGDDEQDANFCSGWLHVRVLYGKWISRKHLG